MTPSSSPLAGCVDATRASGWARSGSRRRRHPRSLSSYKKLGEHFQVERLGRRVQRDVRGPASASERRHDDDPASSSGHARRARGQSTTGARQLMSIAASRTRGRCRGTGRWATTPASATSRPISSSPTAPPHRAEEGLGRPTGGRRPRVTTSTASSADRSSAAIVPMPTRRGRRSRGRCPMRRSGGSTAPRPISSTGHERAQPVPVGEYGAIDGRQLCKVVGHCRTVPVVPEHASPNVRRRLSPSAGSESQHACQLAASVAGARASPSSRRRRGTRPL